MLPAFSANSLEVSEKMIIKIGVGDAVKEIKRAYSPQAQKNAHAPFFFIVGAGISSPAVPLSQGIISDCEKRITELAAEQPQLNDFKSMLDKFSDRFQRAMPQPYMRQSYLRSIIEGEAITYSNLLLARILLDKRIAHLVVTTNFDDFLSRALTLCGVQSRIYDQPQSISNVRHWEDDVQILHVHGTYLYYSCIILRGETEKTARLTQNNRSIVEKLGEILGMSSPLVIGYSGWEGDVIMSALKRRLRNNGGLDSNLYWFCFQESAIESLPNWLKHNSNVRFVVPEKDTTLSIIPAADDEGGTVSALEVRRRELEGFISEEGPKLDAATVFQRLIEEFRIPEPSFISDPLGCYLERLRRSIRNSEDHLGSTIRLISCARELLTSEQIKFQKALRELHTAQFREAINSLVGERWHSVSLPLIHYLRGEVWQAARKLNDNSDEELLAYDIVQVMCDLAVRREDDVQERLKAQIQGCRALIYKAATLGERQESRRAIKVYDLVINNFGREKHKEFRERVARAFIKKAVQLEKLNKVTEAIEVYGLAIAKYKKDQELQGHVAWALCNQGRALNETGKSTEAVKVYDRVVMWYANAEALVLKAQVAMALVNKGAALEKLSQSAGRSRSNTLKARAVATYDEVVNKFKNAASPKLQAYSALALYNKSIVLDTSGLKVEAAEACRGVIDLYDNTDDADVEQVVRNAKRLLQVLDMG